MSGMRLWPRDLTYSYNIDYQLTGTSSGATLSYDPAGRLYQTVSSGGSTTRFAYATANNAAAPGGNNLQQSSVTVAAGNGAISAATSYTYNASGDVRTINGPLGASQSVRYRLDNYRQVTGFVDVDPDTASSGWKSSRLVFASPGLVSKMRVAHGCV
jgi:YD repeat-containing protein